MTQKVRTDAPRYSSSCSLPSYWNSADKH